MNIGRFNIIRELGRGAQSRVYLAQDPKLLREVAIKTLHFDRPDPEQNKALLSEARTISQLRHPNLVPIFEAGEEEGDLFLVFEYVNGKTLAQLIHDAGALTALQSAKLMHQILEGLESAHEHGIIHRDLKPSNILIDERGAPRVMDFGIALKLKPRTEGETEFTGTPAYMAPEYIQSHTISPRTDIFSAGLILYEMLFGHGAIQTRDMYQVMYKLANEDIEIVRDGKADLDDKMVDILYRALARNPEKRFENARQFADALDVAFLNPQKDTEGDGQQGTLDFLLRRMKHKSDFPALSESVSTINRIAQSDNDSIQKLSSAILRDFALTSKLLKLVNSAYFRTAGAGSISTVSRAILVLGFDAVRNLAITVLLFEHLQKSPAKQRLMDEFIQSNFAGLMARNLGKKIGNQDGEQAFICALFRPLGKLLAQFYFPDEAEEIRRTMAQRKLSETQASAQLLGLPYSDLGIGVAKAWGLPEIIVDSMQNLPEGHISRYLTQEDRLRLLSVAANELCSVISETAVGDRKKSFDQWLSRFGESAGLNEEKLQKLMVQTNHELCEFANVVHLNLNQTEFGKQVQIVSGKGFHTAPDENDEASEVTTSLDTSVLADHAVTAAFPHTPEHIGENGIDAGTDVQSILTAGIQDISNTLVEDFKLNDILRIILETMYRAIGFRLVIFSIRDTRTNHMQGRFGFGSNADDLLKKFRFSLAGTPDVFTASVTKGVDVLISNVDDEHIRSRIPNWHRKHINSKTFVLLPLTLKGKPVALIYADRENANEIVIPEKELSLLRTLRNQAVLAIKQSS